MKYYYIISGTAVKMHTHTHTHTLLYGRKHTKDGILISPLVSCPQTFCVTLYSPAAMMPPPTVHTNILFKFMH